MKRILSLLVLASFLWFGLTVYQLLNTTDHFGRSFWTTGFSLSIAIILSVTRISMIEKQKLSPVIAILGMSLLLFSLIAWWKPYVLSDTWNYFVALFALFIATSLSSIFPEKKSTLLKICFWTPWIFLATGILLHISSPLFFSISLALLAGTILLSLYSVLRKRPA